MNKNINLLYILVFLSNTWFWLGIWVLYYLLFTNYAGIGLIETILILGAIFSEIPSGAFADLFGKRKTLIIAYFFAGLGNLIMALATNFSHLVISSVIIVIGMTLISGTFEALTFDSLKEKNKENNYDKVLSKQTIIRLISSAIATILGGVMYMYVSPRAPFLAVSFLYFIAIMVTFSIKEPQVNKNKFSISSYIKQLQQGFHQLFQEKYFRSIIILFLLAGIIPIFMYEMVTDILLASYNVSAIYISIAIFTIYIVAALGAHFSPFFKNKIKPINSFIVLSFLYSLFLIVVPVLNFYLCVVFIAIIGGMHSIMNILKSDIINREISSQYRATTLSTLSMLSIIPYAISASFLGYFSDLYGVPILTAVLGIIMFFGVLFGFINIKK